MGGPLLALGQRCHRHDHDHERAADLRGLSQLWAEDSAEKPDRGVPAAISLGGWLGGALQWHFTFMWIFAAGGLLYVVSQLASGHYRTVIFTPRDVRGVWPMVRHYFFFGPKPAAAGQYNALQKLAYTSTIGFGALSLLTGLVMYKPVQLSALGALFGGYHNARTIHFLAMCGMLAFIPGHLVMVALHGWDNFASMVTGWKRHPEYVVGSK